MKKEKKQIMDIVFLLDRSGSMSGFESDTIGGYNGYLKKMCKKMQELQRFYLMIDMK